MPELPEVETTRRGIAPHVIHHIIKQVVVRHHQLRWPVPVELSKEAKGQRIEACERRGKYLLLRTALGTIIVHLGMSGSLRLGDAKLPAAKHDHIDIVLDTGQALRLTDPRRFGAVLWTTEDPLHHELLCDLGPEPLSDEFNGDYLYQRSRNRAITIKQGGTTLRDFVGGDGKPGYFAQQLNVYGRTGEACPVCGTAIKQLQQGQRSTYYCPRCQR